MITLRLHPTTEYKPPYIEGLGDGNTTGLFLFSALSAIEVLVERPIGSRSQLCKSPLKTASPY